MREVIGELMICSNAGTTRPVPATEVSNVPLSATPVRMDDNLTLGRIIAPTAIIATIIDAAMIATRVQRLRMVLCRSSFGISLSISEFIKIVWLFGLIKNQKSCQSIKVLVISDCCSGRCVKIIQSCVRGADT